MGRAKQRLLIALLFALAACAPAASPASRTTAPTAADLPTAQPTGDLSGGPPQPMPTVVFRDLEGSVEVTGQTRHYLLHLPRNPSGDAALILILGDIGQNAFAAAQATGLYALGDGNNVVVVSAEGTGEPSWNAGFCCGQAMQRNADDVAFVAALIADVNRHRKVDAKRVYLAGFGNGAMLAYRVAVEMPERIAAVAAVAGAMGGQERPPGQPVPVLAIHGDADAQVPLERARDAATFWAQSNGCAAAPQRQESRTVIQETYAGCRENRGVALLTVKGGKHEWFAALELPRGAQPAAQVLWEFFARYAKP